VFYAEEIYQHQQKCLKSIYLTWKERHSCHCAESARRLKGCRVLLKRGKYSGT